MSAATMLAFAWGVRPGWGLVREAFCATALGAMGVWVWRERRAARMLTAGWVRERRVREELEAYARLDGVAGHGGSGVVMAKAVCRTIVEKSAFRRAAMLVVDAEGKLYVAGSAGMDDLAVAALRHWGESAVREDRGVGAAGPAEDKSGRKGLGFGSFLLPLDGSAVRTGRGCRRVVVMMLRGQHGAVLGALAVCADQMACDGMTLQDALAPLAALATKLARGMENASLLERLIRAEKLAGLGRLAAGVSQELNNPLTAVLGFAELIAETASEERTRQDAATITFEARRMKETVESLLQFWRPVTLVEEPVSLGELLGEVAADCKGTLDGRGVKLALHCADDMPPVQGNRERLRQVLEHLLNNAAQAIASSQEGRRATDTRKSGLPRGTDELDREPEIRVTVRREETTLRMIVSDTGPGFPDAARAFDPFYTTRQTSASSGMGLSICYGIVREHGGDILAFNLHPHGAAVVVELPIRCVLAEEAEHPGGVRGREALAGARLRRREDQAIVAGA